MNDLAVVKALLGLSDVTDVDELLTTILSVTEDAMKVHYNLVSVPKPIRYALHEMAVERYNRLSHEGLEEYKVGDVSGAFSKAFTIYDGDIHSYVDSLPVGDENYQESDFVPLKVGFS